VEYLIRAEMDECKRDGTLAHAEHFSVYFISTSCLKLLLLEEFGI
jgi:hypothetical protein